MTFVKPEIVPEEYWRTRSTAVYYVFIKYSTRMLHAIELSVCLSVCLSVISITQERLEGE